MKTEERIKERIRNIENILETGKIEGLTILNRLSRKTLMTRLEILEWILEE